jgi:hypothetical protein
MIMRVSQLFGLMALPVVFALPAATQHSSNEVDTTLNHRSMLTEASQFHFAPFQLTNVGLECSRLAAEEMYACELRCTLYSSALLLVTALTVTNHKVDWHDPNSVKQNNITGCSCIHKWSWDGETASVGENNTYGEAYSLCYKDLPVYFEMRISAFNSTNDFAVEIAHCYHDSEYVHAASSSLELFVG